VRGTHRLLLTPTATDNAKAVARAWLSDSGITAATYDNTSEEWGTSEVASLNCTLCSGVVFKQLSCWSTISRTITLICELCSTGQDSSGIIKPCFFLPTTVLVPASNKTTALPWLHAAPFTPVPLTAPLLLSLSLLSVLLLSLLPARHPSEQPDLASQPADVSVQLIMN
jgi:hypothetical protein